MYMSVYTPNPALLCKGVGPVFHYQFFWSHYCDLLWFEFWGLFTFFILLSSCKLFFQFCLFWFWISLLSESFITIISSIMFPKWWVLVLYVKMAVKEQKRMFLSKLFSWKYRHLILGFTFNIQGNLNQVIEKFEC